MEKRTSGVRILPLPNTARQNISKSFGFKMIWNEQLTHVNHCIETQNPSIILKLHLLNGERLKNRNLKVFRLLNPIVTLWRKSLKFISLFLVKLARDFAQCRNFILEFQRTSEDENLCWQKRQRLEKSRKWSSDFRRSPSPNKTETIGKLNFGQREGNGALSTMQRPLQSAIRVNFGLNFKI